MAAAAIKRGRQLRRLQAVRSQGKPVLPLPALCSPSNQYGAPLTWSMSRPHHSDGAGGRRLAGSSQQRPGSCGRAANLAPSVELCDRALDLAFLRAVLGDAMRTPPLAAAGVAAGQAGAPAAPAAAPAPCCDEPGFCSPPCLQRAAVMGLWPPPPAAALSSPPQPRRGYEAAPAARASPPDDMSSALGYSAVRRARGPSHCRGLGASLHCQRFFAARRPSCLSKAAVRMVWQGAFPWRCIAGAPSRRAQQQLLLFGH